MLCTDPGCISEAQQGSLGCRRHPNATEPIVSKCRRLEAEAEHREKTLQAFKDAAAGFRIQRDVANDQAAVLEAMLEDSDRDRVALKQQVAGWTSYVDEAKRACGDDRVTGEPLAQVITELRRQRDEARETSARIVLDLDVNQTDDLISANEAAACIRAGGIE